MNDRDILELFREADSEPEPDLRRIDVETAVGQGKRQLRAGLARRAAIVTGAIAASVVGAIVVAGLPVFDNSPTGASPAAAAVLNEAARNAGKARPVEAHDGQYIYTRTHAWAMSAQPLYRDTDVPADTPPDQTAYHLSENVHEMWRPVDVNTMTLIRIVSGLKRKPVRPRDEQYLKEAGVDLNAPPSTYLEPDPSKPSLKPNDPNPGTESANPFVNPTPKTLATLPTGADTLLARVRKQAEGTGNSRDEAALSVIIGLFQNADLLIGRDLRAALFRAAAKIPGIERGPSVNLDGQRGIAIGRSEAVNGLREEIIIDPATSRVIGQRTVQVGQGSPASPENDFPVGTVTGTSAIRSFIVDRNGQTTPAR